MIWVGGLALTMAAIVGFLAFSRESRLARRISRLDPVLWFRGEALVVAFIFAVVGMVALSGQSASMSLAARSEVLKVTIRPVDRAPRWGQPSDMKAIGWSLPQCEKHVLTFAPDRSADIVATIYGIMTTAAPGAEKPSAAVTSGSSMHRVRRNVPMQRRPSDEPSVMNPVILESKPDSGIRVVLDPVSNGDFYVSCPGQGRPVPATGKLSIDYRGEARERAPTLSLDGLFTIGGSVSDGIPDQPATAAPLLLSGSIAIEARSWPWKSGRARSEVPLALGDLVHFEQGQRQPAATGIVRADDGALNVIAYAEAGLVKIERRGVVDAIATGYAPSFWVRVQAMSEWAVLVAIGGLLLFLASALERLSSHLRRNGHQ